MTEMAAVTLWRPVGPKELDLIRQSGMRAFPPRLRFYRMLRRNRLTCAVIAAQPALSNFETSLSGAHRCAISWIGASSGRGSPDHQACRVAPHAGFDHRQHGTAHRPCQGLENAETRGIARVSML